MSFQRIQLEEGSEFIKIPPKCINDSISAIEKHVLHIQLKVPTVFEISKRHCAHTRVVSKKLKKSTVGKRFKIKGIP